MELDELLEAKRLLLVQLGVLENLENGLECIERYNRENLMSDELKVMSIIHEPYLEELNSSYVADNIQNLYDNNLVGKTHIAQVFRCSMNM